MRIGSTLLLTAGMLLALSATRASAAAYSGLYVFGDSLSDTGNAYIATGGSTPVSPPYSDGRFSNGALWIQDVAGALGLGPVTPSLAGGNDFAVGGAETGTTLAHAGVAGDLPTQLALFNLLDPSPQPGALYALWIGSNDLQALFGGLASGAIPVTGLVPDLTQVLANIGTAVNALAAGGMRNLLALSVSDLSLAPDARALAATTADPAATLALIHDVTGIFDVGLGSELASLSSQDGFALTYVDTFGPLDQIAADPSAYGLANVTDPCWTGTYTDPASGTVCANPDAYLFWDGEHPTASGHALVADAVLTALPEPGGLALFAVGLAALVLVRRRAQPSRATA